MKNVIAIGNNLYGQTDVATWENVQQIAAGHFHTAGRVAAGTAVATGFNTSGQCNVGAWTDLVDIAAGYQHTVGAKDDGSAVAVGDNFYGQCNIGGWVTIEQVSAGYSHTLGLKTDGTVNAVGRNNYGQTGVGAWTTITQVDAGYHHSVGLKADGTVVAVGKAVEGQCVVGGWTGITHISAGAYHTVGLKGDGTCVAAGYNGDGECDVTGWTNIVQISAGDYFTLGLKSDGTVVACGSNSHGQITVGAWTGIQEVSGGFRHSVARITDTSFGTVTIGATDYYLGTDCEAEIEETIWGGVAIVRLDNSTGALTATNFLGNKVSIALKVDGTGVEVPRPPFWVRNQRQVSEPGDLSIVLYCIDSWRILEEMRLGAGSAISGETIQDWLTLLLEGGVPSFVDMDAVDDPGFTLTEDDTNALYLNYEPLSTFAVSDNDSYLSAIQKLMGLLEDLNLRVEGDDEEFHLREIETVAPDAAYGAADDIVWKSNLETKVTIPNKVLTRSADDVTVVGEAVDAASFGQIGRYFIDRMEFAHIADVAEANALASAILQKKQNEANVGTLHLPIADAHRQLFDYIQVDDYRLGSPTTTTGNIGYLHWTIAPGVFTLEMDLGGAKRAALWEDNKQAFGNLVQAASSPLLTTHSLTAAVLQKAMQPFITDVAFTENAGYDKVQWSNNAIYFGDGSEETVEAGNYQLPDDDPQWVYFDLQQRDVVSGELELQHTKNFYEAVGEYRYPLCLIQRGGAASDSPLILPNNGKMPFISAIAITCDTLSTITADCGTLTAGTINGCNINVYDGDIEFYDNTPTLIGDILTMSGGFGHLVMRSLGTSDLRFIAANKLDLSGLTIDIASTGNMTIDASSPASLLITAGLISLDAVFTMYFEAANIYLKPLTNLQIWDVSAGAYAVAWTGTFTNGDGATVTVEHGIIISVV